MEEELVFLPECKTLRAQVRKNFHRNFEYQRCSAMKHRFYIAQRESPSVFAIALSSGRQRRNNFGLSSSLESTCHSVNSEALNVFSTISFDPALFKIIAPASLIKETKL